MLINMKGKRKTWTVIKITYRRVGVPFFEYLQKLATLNSLNDRS